MCLAVDFYEYIEKALKYLLVTNRWYWNPPQSTIDTGTGGWVYEEINTCPPANVLVTTKCY